MNVSGAGAQVPPGGINPNMNMQLMDTMQSVQDLMAELMNTSDEGAFHAGSSKTDLQNAQAGIEGSNVASLTAKPEFLTHAEEATAAFAANESNELDEIKKRKRKEKAFKEKLNLLMEMVEGMDLSEIEPEDKATIEEFIKNAQTISTLQSELKFLEDKEIYYQGIIKQNKGG
jgi:hypothetical protein